MNILEQIETAKAAIDKFESGLKELPPGLLALIPPRDFEIALVNNATKVEIRLVGVGAVSVSNLDLMLQALQLEVKRRESLTGSFAHWLANPQAGMKLLMVSVPVYEKGHYVSRTKFVMAHAMAPAVATESFSNKFFDYERLTKYLSTAHF